MVAMPCFFIVPIFVNIISLTSGKTHDRYCLAKSGLQTQKFMITGR